MRGQLSVIWKVHVWLAKLWKGMLWVANAVLDERCTFRTGNSPHSMPLSPQTAQSVYYTAPFLTCFVRLNHAIFNSMQWIKLNTELFFLYAAPFLLALMLEQAFDWDTVRTLHSLLTRRILPLAASHIVNFSTQLLNYLSICSTLWITVIMAGTTAAPYFSFTFYIQFILLAGN